jgi:F-type H+-transporting ATPase subunit b
MPDILQQLGALMLGAIPTALLFIVLVIAYQLLVQGPLSAMLKQRRALTEGAIEDAHAAIARAEAKTAEYADKLRQARSEAYKIREQRVKQWNAEREAALGTVRQQTTLTVNAAKAALEAEAETAKLSIQASSGELVKQVVLAVLPLAAGGSR